MDVGHGRGSGQGYGNADGSGPGGAGARARSTQNSGNNNYDNYSNSRQLTRNGSHGSSVRPSFAPSPTCLQLH